MAALSIAGPAEAAAGSSASDAAPAAAAQPPPPRTATERNRIKKLASQYREILALEEQWRLGLPPLNTEQAVKIERKTAVAEELQRLGASVPTAPAASAGGFGGPSGLADLAGSLAGSVGGGLPEGPRRPPSPALLHQKRLAERSPGFSYFIVLPEPLPDMGVKLSDAMGGLFFEVGAVLCWPWWFVGGGCWLG